MRLDNRPRAQVSWNLILCLAVATAVSAQNPALVFDLTNGAADLHVIGASVAPIADLNGDGLPDVLVGAPHASGPPGTGSFVGQVLAYSGGTGALLRKIWGPSGGEFGQAVLGIPDIDNDGVPEIAAGAPGANSFGEVYVYSGFAGTLLYTVSGTAMGGGAGYALASIADLDGDSVTDFLIGAPGGFVLGSFAGPGSVSAVSAATGSILWTVPGTTSGYGFGSAIASGGDVNGDGTADFLAGLPGPQSFLPSATVPSSVEVRSGVNGLVMSTLTNGALPLDNFGWSVAGLGDVNGDQVPDFAIGVPSATWGGQVGAGVVQIHSGANNALIWSHAGTAAGQRVGHSVARGGDWDGDGVTDIVTLRGWAGGALPVPGAALVLSGATGTQLSSFGGLLGELVGEALVVGLGDLDGNGSSEYALSLSMVPDAGRVYAVSPSTAGPLWAVSGDLTTDSFGFSVAAAGDVDGDQVGDLLVGAPLANGLGLPDSGRVKLFSGASGTLLADWPGTLPFEGFGYSLASPGDLDGDGTPEVIAGAPFVSNYGTLGTGRVTVFSGGGGGSALHLFSGLVSGSHFGAAVAALADIDGDGISEIVVGAPDAPGGGLVSSGEVRVYSGASGVLVAVLNGLAAGDRFGHALADAGDVNGDGIPDLAVGAPQGGGVTVVPSSGYAGGWPGNPPGYVRVFSGATGQVLLTAAGTASGDQFGSSLVAAGDIDGDGTPDLAIGAPAASPGGAVVVISGATGQVLLSHSGTISNESTGSSLAAAGDLDGDGVPDLAVGALGWRDAQGAWLGQVRVLSGQSGAVLFTSNGIPGGPLYPEGYGHSLAALGDISGDGRDDLLLGIPGAYFPGLAKWRGRAQMLSPFTQGPPPQLFGTACSAWPLPWPPSIGWTGLPTSLGNSAFSITLGFAAPGSWAVLMLGGSNTAWSGGALPHDLTPYGLGGCSLLVSPDLLITVPTSGAPGGTPLTGTASVSLPIPANPALAGLTAYFQWFALDPAAPIAPAGLSQGLQVTLW